MYVAAAITERRVGEISLRLVVVNPSCFHGDSSIKRADLNFRATKTPDLFNMRLLSGAPHIKHPDPNFQGPPVLIQSATKC